jgi:hypothetical protein
MVAHTDKARRSGAGKPASRHDAIAIVLSVLHHHTPHATTKQCYKLLYQALELLL